MRADELAALVGELDLLKFRIEGLPESTDKNILMSQFLTVADIINDVANRKLRSLLKRRGA